MPHENSQNIVDTGDVTIDWNLARTRRSCLLIGPEELLEDEQEKDRVLIRGIPKFLSRAGYTSVKSPR